MFYQNIGPSSVHVFQMSQVYFSSKKPVITCDYPLSLSLVGEAESCVSDPQKAKVVFGASQNDS
jgi:hypothetical protein